MQNTIRSLDNYFVKIGIAKFPRLSDEKVSVNIIARKESARRHRL